MPSKLVPSSDAESTALRHSLFVKIRSIRGLKFPVCLLRSRSCRPSGCLRQATQPAPAGMCSGLPPHSRSCRPTGCLWQAVLVRIPPAYLTLRATYAACRATALLLGSQRFRLSKTLTSLFVPENLQTKGFFSHLLNATRFAPFAQGIWAVIDPAWPLNSEAVCGNLGKKDSVSQWVYGFK